MISEYDLMELVLGDPEALAQHWNDDRWRVRYAAAVAMGETGDPRWLPELHRLLVIEDGRDLYSQPRVMGFVGSFDDTRMAEQLIRTEAIFDREYSPEALDAWACRGRVKQACLLAVHTIGEASDDLLVSIYRALDDPHEDFVVKTAAAKALARVGDRESIPYLTRAVALDEWCLRVEATKALRALGEDVA